MKSHQCKQRPFLIKLDSQLFWNFSAILQQKLRWVSKSILIRYALSQSEYFDSRFQSFVLCLVGIVLCPNLRSSSSSRAAATRLVQHKDTLIKIIKLADSNSVICRSKSFVVLYLILNMQPDLLLAACKHKVSFDLVLNPMTHIKWVIWGMNPRKFLF